MSTTPLNSLAIPDPDATSLARRGVKYLVASYVDIHGVSKCKMVPVDHFDQMMTGSELFTGAARDGVGVTSPRHWAAFGPTRS